MSLKCVPVLKQLSIVLRRGPTCLTCMSLVPKGLHTSTVQHSQFDGITQEAKRRKRELSKSFLEYNKVVYPPREEGEEPRPAEICHQKNLVPMSAKKLWYAAVLVRGMSIDEALLQCEFSKSLASKIVREALIEAQELAVGKYNVEYQSNLWVADSMAIHQLTEGGIRRHAIKGMRIIKYRYSTYMVRLREGQPPEHYYPPEATGYEKLEEYIKSQRERRITHGL